MENQSQSGAGDTLVGPPSPQYAAYHSYPAPPRDRGPVSRRQATWALVLALVPMPVGWLCSLVLAITVLWDSRDGRGKERGVGMATAALILVPLWVVVTVVALLHGGLGGTVTRNSTGHVTMRGDALTSSLRTGDCLAQAPEVTTRQRTVPVVPCSQAHAGEVFATFRLPSGGYPGEAEVRRLAEGGCVRRFDASLAGTSAAASRLFYYRPSPVSWSSDRRIVCIAVAARTADTTV